MSDERVVIKNKLYRGRVLRTMDTYYPNDIELREIKSTLQVGGLAASGDVIRIVDYLIDKGYVKLMDKSATGIFEDGDLLKLTAMGVDLLEGTIVDEGVNVL